MVSNRLWEISQAIKSGSTNLNYLEAEGDILTKMSEVNFKASRHALMHTTKRKVKVAFYDTSVKPELTPEQKVSAAAKTLVKARTRKATSK